MNTHSSLTLVLTDLDLYRMSKLKEQRVADDKKLARYDSKTFARITKNILIGNQNVSTEALEMNSRDWQLLLSTAAITKYACMQ